MLPNDIDLDQTHDRFEQYVAEATSQRRPTRSTAGIRRAIGHRFIALGRRIAAEPTFELARSSR